MSDKFFGLSDGEVTLRVMEEKDLEKVYSWKNNFELTKMIMSSPVPVARYQIEEWYRALQGDKNEVLFGIYVNSSIAGIVRIMSVNRLHSIAKFGMYIGENNLRSKGTGKKVLNLVLNYAFKDLNLNKISLTVLEKNTIAIKLYENEGFKKEGLLRQEFWLNGRYENLVVMGMLREEYERSDAGQK